MPAPYLVSSIPEHQLSEFYRLMTEEIGDVAVFFMDTAGVITTWNRAAELMKGYTADEAIGHPLAMLYTIEDRERGWPQHNLQEAAKHGYYKEETWRRKKDGSQFWARVCLTALKDGSGKLLGFSKITLDLTDHKLLETCVKEREQTRRVLRAANAGSWRWNPERNEVSVCENFLRLLGDSGPDRTIPVADWLDYFHEDDRQEVASRLARARSGAPFELEVRLRSKDGSLRWFYCRAEWFRELDAQPWELNGVNVDIESVKAAQEEVRRAIEKLQEADARKDEFLAMLAHELRNPLAPIRAAAEVMNHTALTEERLRRTSEVITRQCNHLTELVDDLLDVSRVTRGLVQLDKAPQNIRHILTDAIEQATPAIRMRQHRLTVTQSADAATVLGDKKRLVQVIANLLDNSAKYTPPGGDIQVSTEVRDDALCVVVADNGIGMEPVTRDHAFDLFSQAKRSRDRAGGGLGLGLALVKSLVDLHGGEVTCASEGPGKGSTFEVCLPMAPSQGGHERGTLEAGAAQPGQQLRITVVDDNRDAADMLSMLLESLGHAVTTHYSSTVALEQSQREAADVYLLDIGLPEMDGHELVRRLKAQPRNSRSAFVAITGYGQESDRAETARAGFSHHLVKPADRTKLVAVLNDIVSRQGN